MNNNICRILALGVIMFGWSGVIKAEGIQITPGKWETTTTAKMPMTPQERVEKSIDCVTQTQFTPEDLLQNNDGGCSFTDISVQENTMYWKMECPSSMGGASGQGEFTSEGNTAHGSMQMAMTMEGQAMTFETHWEGQRIGECD